MNEFQQDIKFELPEIPEFPTEVPKKPSFLKRFFSLEIGFEILEMLAIAIAIVMVLMTVFVRYSPVEGSSMEPSLHEADVLIVSGFLYTPRRGDIVIIHVPYNFNMPFVKRVIAVGGDVLEIDFYNWQIRVNGVLQEEDYINFAPRDLGINMAHHDLNIIDGVYTAIVPNGHSFVLGDNRNGSQDSRNSNIGFVDNRYVVGRAMFRIWPFSRAGGV